MGSELCIRDRVKSIDLALFDKRLRLFKHLYGGVRFIFEQSDSSVNLYNFENVTVKIEAKKKF